MLLLLMTADKEECQTPKKDDHYHKISHATARTLTITTVAVKLLIQAGSQIEDGAPLQAGGIGHLF